MAKFKNGMLSGALGKLVFKIIKGECFAVQRMEPGTMKQSKGTKAVGKTFGRTSAFAMYFMSLFKMQLKGLQDPGMCIRLMGLLNKLLYACQDENHKFSFKQNSFKSLVGFEFNKKSPFNESFKTIPIISFKDGALSIVLNELDNPQQIAYPEYCSTSELIAGMVLFRLKDGFRINSPEIQSIMMKRGATELSQHEFVFAVPDGCLCMVSLSLNFYSMQRNYTALLNNKDFHPMMICEALISPGEYKNSSKYHWQEVDGMDFN